MNLFYLRYFVTLAHVQQYTKAAEQLCIAQPSLSHASAHMEKERGLPLVEKSREELESCELYPFRAAIKAGIPAIMTSHVLFPALEPERIPATMSRRILTGILRGEFGFDGIIISDCMEMRPLLSFTAPPRAPRPPSWPART